MSKLFHWWEQIDFHPEDTPAIQKGDKSDAVKDIQRLLKNIGYDLLIDGQFGPGTDRVVREFQEAQGLVADGRVGKRTLRYLNDHPKDPRLLTQEDIRNAAKDLDLPIPVVLAVTEIEARGEGFFDDDRVVILYERHVMWRQLKAHNVNPAPYEQSQPNIVNRNTGGYVGGIQEHTRQQKAIDIHTEAGYASASYGLFQIMGFHWEMLGYDSAEAYASAMQESEANHLKAFVAFIKADAVLWTALKERDWATFAERYNGPAYKKNNYDVKLADAFDRHTDASKEASFIV